MKTSMLRSVSLLALASCALAAQAQNLVVNGGFETGDFTGYTANVGSFTFVTSGLSHSGSYAAIFQDSRTSTLTQQVATTAGGSYLVSFFLRETSNGSNPADLFSLSFGSGSISIASMGTDYERYSFIATATTDSTTLTIGGLNVPDGFVLDDVSVVANASAVPGPVAALPFALMALRRRKRA